MSGFRADVDQLARRASEFEDLAGRARRIAADLRHAIEAAGECWGRDEVGQRFAAVHQQPAGNAIEHVEQLAGQLRAIGGNFAETAATYRRADATGVAELHGSGPVGEAGGE